MILCLTPNPAIDRTLIVPNLALGSVHRASRTIVAAGGKGLNVARTIRKLGGEPLCLGFVGGHSGHFLAELAQAEGLNSIWTWTNTETRTCTILVSQNGDATEIDEPGSPVSSSDWEHLRRDVRKRISSTDLVCISGSLPPDSPLNAFKELLRLALQTSKQVWVDTSGAALEVALASPGICVKVNGYEISKTTGLDVNDLDSAKHALRILLERGLAACAITLGAAGALLATKAGRWHAQGPEVNVVSSIGSGDSFLGGLVCALNDDRDWPESLRDAIAAGTANTLSAGGGQFDIQEFIAIREQTRIQGW